MIGWGMRKRKVPMGALALAILSLNPGKASALGDFGSVTQGFWSIVIASYWWESRQEWLNSSDPFRSYDEQAADILPGEREPVGIVTALQTAAPPNFDSVSCSDFRVVTISEIAQDGDAQLPFRIHQPKGAVYYTLSGTLARIGFPSEAEFWVAAMLPDNSTSLFSSGGLGINPEVLSHPLMKELGYSGGLHAIPADSLRLQSVTQCVGFSIYNVRFEK